MKIIWALILGMFIFQSLFVAFGVFFNADDTSITEGIGETDTSDLNLRNPGGLWDLITGTPGTTVMAALTAIGIGVALLAKNYVAVAVVMFLGFLSWLYVQTADIFIQLNNTVGGGDIALVFITIFNAVIAILAVKEIISMLAPGGVD